MAVRICLAWTGSRRSAGLACEGTLSASCMRIHASSLAVVVPLRLLVWRSTATAQDVTAGAAYSRTRGGADDWHARGGGYGYGYPAVRLRRLLPAVSYPAGRRRQLVPAAVSVPLRLLPRPLGRRCRAGIVERAAAMSLRRATAPCRSEAPPRAPAATVDAAACASTAAPCDSVAASRLTARSPG